LTPSQIRALRLKLGKNGAPLSPEDFAVALGFGRKSARITVWQWETGRRTPSEQTVRLLNMLLKGDSDHGNSGLAVKNKQALKWF
jgi:DNA-binding transcriptional regulator YiaG